MKIAVISDVHGNVPAMEAVIEDLHSWKPDQVVINGDLVNRGPYSHSVLSLIQAANKWGQNTIVSNIRERINGVRTQLFLILENIVF